MSYLERLKNLKVAPTHPTKTTKTPETGEKPVFVVSVGCPPRHIENSLPAFEAVPSPPTPSSSGPKAAPQRPNPGDVALDGAIVSSRLTARLMAAAMRHCDHVGDSEAAREAMRLDVLATPLRLQQDLLDHFTSIAPPTQPAIQRQRQTVTAKPIVSTKAERFGAWEATWKPLAIAYHTHHFNCHLCMAAGKRQDGQRCEVGAGLWDAYQSAVPTDPPR